MMAKDKDNFVVNTISWKIIRIFSEEIQFFLDLRAAFAKTLIFGYDLPKTKRQKLFIIGRKRVHHSTQVT